MAGKTKLAHALPISEVILTMFISTLEDNDIRVPDPNRITHWEIPIKK